MPALPAWPASMGSWTITSTLMCGPAWRPVSLEELWLPAPNRGKDRIIPGAAGAVAKPRRKDSRTVGVPLWISGAVNQAGTPNADPIEGFQANIDALNAGVVTPPTLPTVTRTSTLTMPNAASRTAAIVVEDFEFTREDGFGAFGRAVLTITIPAGEHS